MRKAQEGKIVGTGKAPYGFYYADDHYHPDLYHGPMLGTGIGRHQAQSGYNPVGVGNVGRGAATEQWVPTVTS